MAKCFYPRIAFSNLLRNRKMYFPYILTCIITVVMFYIIHSLYLNEGIALMRGGETVQFMLSFGAWIVGIFAVIFLFYTNSFVVKRRQREFGLYNVLGMEKRHLGMVLAFETLYIALLSLFFGLLLGVVLDKLMYLIIAKILRSNYGIGFFVSYKSMAVTLALFVAIFTAIYIQALIRLKVSHPIEMLKGESMGEKVPKTRYLMAVIGTICLVSGYVLAMLANDIQTAISIFFFAVILVIIGTYLVFTAGSIALLRLLKKNKKYYYKTNHFTSVSGLTYRMKQNAVGLASICILVTMLLVTVSTTTSFMVGIDNIIDERFPYDVIVQSNTTESANTALLDDVNLLCKEHGLTVKKEILCKYLPFQAFQNGNVFSANKRENTQTPIIVIALTAESYNAMSGENKVLNGNEVLIYEQDIICDCSTIDLLGINYTVKEKVGEFVKDGFLANGLATILGGMYVVVADDSALNDLYASFKENYGESAGNLQFSYGVNLNGGKGKHLSFADSLKGMIEEKNYVARYYVREEHLERYISLCGGVFFLGIYLGALFLMATILIIYYKQISEGYEDKKRFEIMQKVGMSYREVKRSISSQILTVFFLPLIMAGIHVAFAFHMIETLLKMAHLANASLVATCSLGCFAVVAVIYIAVYLLTAKVYYRIVKSK